LVTQWLAQLLCHLPECSVVLNLPFGVPDPRPPLEWQLSFPALWQCVFLTAKVLLWVVPSVWQTWLPQ
jgi:hypothetical protein